jgi:hypothetical protein
MMGQCAADVRLVGEQAVFSGGRVSYISYNKQAFGVCVQEVGW